MTEESSSQNYENITSVLVPDAESTVLEETELFSTTDPTTSTVTEETNYPEKELEKFGQEQSSNLEETVILDETDNGVVDIEWEYEGESEIYNEDKAFLSAMEEQPDYLGEWAMVEDEEHFSPEELGEEEETNYSLEESIKEKQYEQLEEEQESFDMTDFKEAESLIEPKTESKDMLDIENRYEELENSGSEAMLEVEMKNYKESPEGHDSESSFSFFESEEKLFAGDYSNKVIIIGKNDIEIVKIKLDLDQIKRVVFVLDRKQCEEIRNNVYHLDDLQCSIANALGIQPEKLKLSYLASHAEYIKKNFRKVELTTTTLKTELEPSISSNGSVEFKEVAVDGNECGTKKVIIAIQDLTHGTQWLGGYRNPRTGLLYHNAATQTDPRKKSYGQPPWYKSPSLYSRDSQTPFPYKEISINLPVDHSTQMWRSDYYIPADTDVVISPRYYIPYSGSANTTLKEQAAIVIQKYWRGFKTRREIIPKVYQDDLHYKEFKDKLLKPIQEQPTDQEIFARPILDMIFPYRRKDFYNLHWFIKKARLDMRQKSKLFSNLSSKLAFSCFNFEKELKYIEAIGKLRIFANKDALATKEKEYIEKSSVPKVKMVNDREFAYLLEEFGMEKWREVKEMYVLHKKENETIEDRLEMLMSLLQYLEYYDDFEMKDDLQELMERESILLSSGIPPKYLKELRRRSEEIILHTIICRGNRLAATRKRIPFKEDVRKCNSCGKYKYACSFPVYIEQNKSLKCNSCVHIQRSSHVPIKVSTYRNLVQLIRKDEYSRGCRNPYIALVGPEGMQYIIRKIWGTQSIISGTSIFSLLRLPRWDNRKPWAPWNCILLTEEEARLHETIEDVYSFYGEYFCNLVKQKNIRALNELGSIAYLERISRNTWSTLPHKSHNVTTKTLVNAFAKAGDRFFQPPPPKKSKV